jgi:hypothetical protein
MTRREFVQEYAGILNLLKEHAYLGYSPSGQAEYRDKERSAVSYFLYLVFKRTGLDLPLPDPAIAEIHPTDPPSFDGARNFMKRTAQRLKAAALDPSLPRRSEYETACRAWLRAISLMDGGREA